MRLNICEHTVIQMLKLKIEEKCCFLGSVLLNDSRLTIFYTVINTFGSWYKVVIRASRVLCNNLKVSCCIFCI